MDRASIALDAVAGVALRTGTRLVEPADVEAVCAERGLDHDAWFAALQTLRHDGLVQLQTAPPSTVVLLAVTNTGLARHLERARPDLGRIGERLAAAVAAAVGAGPVDLATAAAEPPLLVEWLLDRWVDDHLLLYSKAPGRRFRVHRLLGDLPGPAAATAEPAAG